MLTTRFAPSPTGLLHLGHARSALEGWGRARAVGGRFLLRMEDIDVTRSREECVTAILTDLAWLGIDWDGEVERQSAWFDAYAGVIAALATRGLAYPCFCTRAQVMAEIAASGSAPHAPDGAPLYPGTCRRIGRVEARRRIDAGERHAWRLDMAAALLAVPGRLSFEEEGQGAIVCAPERFGDVVLARKDAPASYHLCVTHDDARQGVTLVTRGEDLRPATDLHRLLQALMGWKAPRYAHHPLLRDASGQRLSKRDGALALGAMREAGVTPAEVRRLSGWMPP